jgi:spore maturation protein CgeB
MRVIIIQEAGRHDENRNFRECLSLQRAFIYNGNECDVWGLGHSNYKDIPDWNSYDLIMNIENYDSIEWIPDLSHFNSPMKILWSIDAHCRGVEIYENTFSRGRYDFLLHSTRDFVTNDYHLWFPNCFDDDLINKLDIEKKYKIGFCGNYVNRKELLDWMQSRYHMKHDIFVIGESMVRSINEYHIHFNKNMLNDINYRNFETIGTGTVLLTSYNSDYELLGFEHDKNCLIYKSNDDIIRIMDSVTNDPDRIQKIGKKGYELSKDHTYKIRVKQLIEQIWKK